MNTEQKNDNFPYFRDQYRRLLRAIISIAILAMMLTLILVFLIFTRNQPRYYATTNSGTVVPMHPLIEPVITNSYLLRWASLATRAAFNIDFVHYNSELKEAKSNFTPEGWKKFIAAMNSSGLLSAVRNKKLEMSAVVSGYPVILNASVLHRHFTWRVQLPILVTFTSASQTLNSRWLVTLNIERISTLNAYESIQINDFSASSQ